MERTLRVDGQRFPGMAPARGHIYKLLCRADAPCFRKRDLQILSMLISDQAIIPIIEYLNAISIVMEHQHSNQMEDDMENTIASLHLFST